MGNFDKPDRNAKVPDIPERLKRLDRELQIERTKQIDYLYAVRKNEWGEDYRIKVSIMRRIRPDGCEFVATCCLNGKVLRSYADSPAIAYHWLARQISSRVSRILFERNFSKIAA